MFKRFEPKPKALVKKSTLRALIQETQLPLEKSSTFISKCDFSQLVSNLEEYLFFSYENNWIPTLRVLYSLPDLLPVVMVDRGAIKHIIKGADVMCPGLTHKDARMDTELPAGTVVQIRAFGKELAVAIGILTLSTAEIRSVNKGMGVQVLHYLGDLLYMA